MSIRKFWKSIFTERPIEATRPVSPLPSVEKIKTIEVVRQRLLEILFTLDDVWSELKPYKPADVKTWMGEYQGTTMVVISYIRYASEVETVAAFKDRIAKYDIQKQLLYGYYPGKHGTKYVELAQAFINDLKD